ncbi:MAG: hypothetical protein N2316_05130 [Spirochaetes bacterium]|nr:hypothetical protein [Spirochaetota bacterium]
MAIKPIDLQVNISQMHDVAKGENARAAVASELQGSLANESTLKARLVPTRIEENKKAEHAVIVREEKQGGKNKNRRQRELKEVSKLEGDVAENLKDDRLGKYIDVRK